MKKNLFALLLCATVLTLGFSSCKGDGSDDNSGNNGGNGSSSSITSLTIKPSTLTLAVGESTRLSAVVEPSGAKADITWKSSNEEIVTVSANGTVEALAEGTANVTAECGDLKSVCAVTVKDYFETLTFTGAFVYNYDTTYSDVLDTLRDESWGSQFFVAKKVLCNVELFTEGFYVDDEGKLAGAESGAILEFEAPFYWAPAWANSGSGTIFVLGNWIITTEYPDSTTTVGRPYSINEAEYVAAINDFVQDRFINQDMSKAAQDLQKAGNCITGARLTSFEYHTTEEGYGSDGYYSSYIPDIVISEGDMEFDADYAASNYMLSVTYHAIKGKDFSFESDSVNQVVDMFGVRFKETETSIDLVDNAIHFGKEYSFDYGIMPAAPARKAALRPLQLRQFTPEQMKRHMEQKNNSPLVKQNVK